MTPEKRFLSTRFTAAIVTRSLVTALLLGGCSSARIQPVAYWNELGGGAEPLSIHVLRVDLHDKSIQVDVVIADDPDRAGPAEATLTNPIELARRAKVLAAVNANAFAGLRDSTGKIDNRWREGLAVNIAGIAMHDGVARSPGKDSVAIDMVFGIDAKGKAYIGRAPNTTALEEAVNAWSFRMLENAEPIPKPGGVRHPRTTVGVDSTGRWLYIVVVDGRQEGYSVGMTPRELSDLMLRLGAHRAVNLDGGGSSILLVEKDGAVQIMNRPSGGQPRPVPVLLTIRRRGAK